MSIQAMAAVVEMRGVPTTQKMILLLLANAHNRHSGACFPDQQRLADEAEVNVRTVERGLKWLEERGYIKRETRHLGRGKGSETHFELSFLHPTFCPVQLNAPDNDDKCTRHSRQLDPTPMSGEYRKPESNRNIPEENKGRTSSTSDPRLPDKNLSDGELFETGEGVEKQEDHPEFDQAWKLYNSSPLKANQIRKKAEAAWKVAVRKVPARLILKAIADEVDRRVDFKSRKAEGRAQRDEFVPPLPAMHRWLQDERFNDVLDQLQSETEGETEGPEEILARRVKIFEQRGVWLKRWGDPPAEVARMMVTERAQ